MPHFPQNIGIWFDFLDHFAEIPPEGMIHLVGNIQTPPVDIGLLNPVPPQLKKIILDLRIRRIEFGHRSLKCKSLVGRYSLNDLQRPFLYMEPIIIP
ncbi:hypothetical protein D3C81_1529150 [compost metagenome]